MSRTGRLRGRAHGLVHAGPVAGTEVRDRSADEAAFLAIGEGARTWLFEAAPAGTARMNMKMAEAVTLAKIAGAAGVDRALGNAALHGRFAHPDLASILDANIRRTTTHTANEATSLTRGTGAWAAIGNPAPKQQALRTLELITCRENLVVRGPSGTGITFFLEALGQQAVEAHRPSKTLARSVTLTQRKDELAALLTSRRAA